MKHLRNARSDERLHIFLRDDATDIDHHVWSTNLLAFIEKTRHEHEVRVGHHRRCDAVAILVARADSETARRLP